MNHASTRHALRQLAQRAALRREPGLRPETMPSWLDASHASARPYRFWQRAVAAVLAWVSFVGPLSVTIEQGREAAGVIAAGKPSAGGVAGQVLADLLALRLRLAMTAAQAAPITDPTAPIRFQPGVTQSTGLGGGVPVVNITAPNAAGISLNQYQSFNIDPVGLILNNSLMSGTSLTGGDVRANPNLAGRAASVIVNQVSSTGSAYASLLNGPLEVFGAPAAVVIANPNGITTRGTGFTNTIGVTLSTGAPQFLGELGGARSGFDEARAIGYDVRGGHLQIEGNAGVNGPGAGIEGTVGTIDLIGETIGVNAPLYAGTRINVIAGRQFVLPSTASAQGTAYATSANGAANTREAIGAANGRAIDATAFGAMTAGQIQVISTAAGMGVRADAQLAANAGDLSLSSNGDLSLAGTAAQQQVTIQANGDVAMTGAHLGVGDYTLQAGGNVSSLGAIQAGGRLAVAAGGKVALADAQSNGDMTIAGDGGVRLGDAQSGTSLKAVASHGDGDVEIDGAVATAQGVSLQAGRDVAINGQVGTGTLQATAQRSIGVSGTVQTSGTMGLSAATGDATIGGTLAGGDTLTIRAGHDIVSSGKLQGSRDIALQAGNSARIGDVQAGGVLGASALGQAGGGDLSLDGNAQVVGAANLAAARDVSVTGSLNGGSTLTLDAQRDVNVGASGTVQAVSDLSITAHTGNVNSQGTLTGATTLTVKGGQDVMLTGTTGAIGDTRLSAGRDLTIGGTLAGHGLGLLDAGRDATLGGSTGYLKDLTVTTGGDLSVTGSALGNAVTLSSGGSMTLNDVQSNGMLSATANGDALTVNGTVTSLAEAQAKSSGDLVVNGTLQSSGKLDATSGGRLSIGGSVNTLSSAALTAARDIAIGGTLQASDALTLTGGGDLSVAGTLNALSSAQLVAGGKAGVSGLVQSAGPLSLSSGADSSISGRLSATGDLALSNLAGSLASTGTIEAGGDLRIDAAKNVDLGTLSTTAQHDMTIQAGGDLVANGTVIAQGKGTLDAGGTLGGAATLGFGGAAVLNSVGDMALTGSLRGDTVQVGSQASASLHDVQAVSTLSITAARQLETTGSVVGNAATRLQAGGDLAVRGTIESSKDLRLAAGRRIASTGSLATNQDLHVQAGDSARIGDARVGGALDASAAGQAGGGDLSFDGNTQVAGAANLAAARDIAVTGSLSGGSTLTLDARRGVNVGASGTVQAASDLSITAHTGNVDSQGTLTGATTLTVKGGQDVMLTGTTGAIGDTRLSAGRDLTIGGTLAGHGLGLLDAGRDATLGGSTGYLKDLTVTTGGDLSVTGSALGNAVTLSSGGSMTLNDVQSNGMLSATSNGGALTVNGTVTSLADAQAKSSGDLVVNGTLQSSGKLDATSGGALSVPGTITALSSAALVSTRDTKVGGLVQSTGPLAVTSGADTAIEGKLASAGDIVLHETTGSLTSTGTIESGGDLRIDAAKNVDLGALSTTAQHDMTIQAGGDLAANGTVIAQGKGSLDAGGTLGGAGSLAFGAAADLTSGGGTALTGSLRGDTVRVQSNGSASVNDVLAASTLSITAANRLATNGALRVGASATLQAGGDLELRGDLQTAGDASLQSATGQVAASGAIASNGALTIGAGTDIVLAGPTGAALGMTLDAARDVAASGALTVLANDLRITAGNSASLADVQAAGAFHLVAGGQAGGGDASLSGTAAIVGATDIQAARDVIVAGTLAGGGDGTSGDHAPTRVQAGRDVRVDGMLGSGDVLTVAAGRDIAVGGKGQLQSTTDMSLSAIGGSLLSGGTIASERDLTVGAAQDIALAGTSSAKGNTSLSSGRDLAIDGSLVGNGSARLSAGQDLTLGGASGFAGDVDAQGGRDLAVTGALQGQAVTLTAARNVDLHDVQAGAALAANAKGGALTLGGTVAALGTSSLQAGTALSIAGQLQGAGEVALSSLGGMSIDGTVKAGAGATVQAAGDLSLAGTLQTAGDANLSAGGKLGVSGIVDAGAKAGLHAAQDLSIAGTLGAGGTLDLRSGGKASIDGIVTTTADGTLGAAGDIDVRGTVQTGGALTVTGGGDTTLGGTLASAGDLVLGNANGAFGSTGTLQSGGKLSIDAAKTIDLGNGRTTALGDLLVTAGQDLHANGTVIAQHAGTLDAGGALVAGGTIAIGDAATLRSGGDMQLAGAVQGASVNAKAGGNAVLHDMTAAGAIDVDAAGQLNTTGTLASNGTLALHAGQDLHQDGMLQSQGDMLLESRGGSLASSGTIGGNGALALRAAGDIGLGGTAAAALATTLAAGHDLAVTGALTTHGTLDASAGNDLSIAGSAAAAGDTRLDAKHDLNVAGTLGGDGSGTLNAGNDLGGTGTVSFAKATTLSAGRDIAQGGLIQGDTVAVTAAGNAAVANVQANGALSLKAAGTNGAGDLAINGTAAAGGAILANAAHDVTVAGKLQGGSTVDVAANHGVTIGGAVQSASAMSVVARQGDLAATGGINSGGALALNAGQDLSLGATTSAVGDLTLTAGRDARLGSGLLIGDASGKLQAGRDLVGGGTQSFVQGALDASAQRQFAFGGTTQAQSVRVQAGNDASLNDVVSATTLDVKAQGAMGGGDVTLLGKVGAAGAVSVDAARDVLLSGTLNNGGTQSLSAQRDVTVSGGTQSAGDMSLAAAGGSVAVSGSAASGGALGLKSGLDTSLAGTVTAAGAIDVDAGRDLVLGGTLAGQKAGRLDAGHDIGGAGSTAFAGAATLGAGHDVALGGPLQGASLAVTGANSVTLAGAQALTGALAVTANGTAGGGDVNLTGPVTALGALSVQAARDAVLQGAVNTGDAATITAERNLSVGDVNAAGALSLTATSGSLQAVNLTTQHELAASAGSALSVTGKVLAGGDATLDAGGDLTLAGDIAAQNAGTLNAGGTLSAAAVAFGKQASLNAAGDLKLSGPLSSNGDIAATAGGDLTLGAVQSGGAIALRAQGTAGNGDVNVGGALRSGGAIRIDAARDVGLAGAVASGAALNVDAARNVALHDSVASNGDMTLNAASGALVADRALSSVGNLTATAGSTLTLAQGALVNGNTALSAVGDLSLGGALLGLGSATLHAGGSLTGAALSIAKDLGVDAGNGLTLGEIQSGGRFTASSGGDLSLGATTSVGDASLSARAGSIAVTGALSSGGTAQLDAARDVAVTGGVAASGAIDINARGGDATIGGLTSNAGATVQATNRVALSGASVTVGDLSLSGGDLAVTGNLSSSGNLKLDAQRSIDTSGAQLVASHDVHLAGQQVSMGGVLAGGALDARAADQLKLSGGTVGVVGTATLSAGNALSNAASVLAGGGLSVSAAQVTNAANASLASTGATTITATNFTNAGLVNGTTTQVSVAQWLVNAGGALMGVNGLTVDTGTLDNRNGVLFAGNANDATGQSGDLSLTVHGSNGALNNTGGQLLAQRNLGIDVSNMTFDPTQGIINQRGGLWITAGWINVGGTWNYGGQSVTLNGLNGITNTGTMTGTAALTLSAGGSFQNYGQVSGSDVTLNGTLANYAGAVFHADNVLTLNGDTYNRGTVEAGNALNVTGSTYDNQGATTQSRGNASFNLGGGTLQNTGGSIFVGNNLTINAGTVVNDQTAPGAAVTTTTTTVDPNLLWSGAIGTSTVNWWYWSGGDHNFNYIHSSQHTALLGDILSPTGVAAGFTAPPYLFCGSGCGIAPSQPIAGSGTVTFYKYGTAQLDGSEQFWMVDNGSNGLGRQSVTLSLPTATVTTTTQQLGTSGVISAGNGISLTAGNLSNRGGKIAAQGDVQLNVQSLSNGAVAPTLTNQTVTAIDPGQYAAFLGQLKALGMIVATTKPVGGRTQFCFSPTDCPTDSELTQTFTINTASAAPIAYGTTSMASATGMVAAGGNLSLIGGNLVNAGLLYAGRDVQIGAQSFSNQGGNQQNFSGQVGCASGVPNSACGNAGQPRGNNPVTGSFSYNQSDATIYAGHDLVVAAGNIDNTYGNLLAGHDIALGGVGTTAGSTTPAQSLNNTSGNIVAGNDIKLNVSGAITNNLPPPVPVHENYGKQEQYAGCMTAGGYKESYCEAYVDQQSGSSSVISAGNKLDINAGSLTNIGSLIAAGNAASIVVSGPVVNEAQTLNAYWHSHWVQETGMFSKDKRHDIWACGTPEQCQALYGSAYTSTGGQIDPPTPVGNIAATIQAPNLSIVSNGQIQNVGNVIGTSVSLSGQKLINGITQPNVYTPSVSAPQRVITLSPSTLPGLNLSIPRTVGTGTLPTPVPGKAVYVDDSLGSSAIGSLGAQDLLDNLPASLKSGPAVFYYNPQEENLLLQQAALQQTGKASFVDGLSYDSTSGVSVVEQEKAYLYQNAIDYAKQNDLQLGQALTQSQVDQLDRPMLWYVEQTFPDPACTATGTGQCPMITALMPQVYLPKDVGAMSAGGNIVGKDVTLSFNQDGHGSVLNTGSITASGTLSVDTQTLTNQANQVNVGEIWQKVDGGYVKTTGTTVQPGGFMSAANMDLNVEALNQIGGALKQLNPDGTVDAAGTQALLASLQQQLGGNFTQQTLTDQLHTDFVKEGGAFGMDQLGTLVVAVVASIMTYGAASAAIGSLATTGSTFVAAAGSASAGLGNVVLSSAIAGIASSAAGQLVGTGKLNLGSAFEAGAIAAITAGLMNGITYSAESGLGFTTQPVTAGAGTQTLANLAGVKPVVGTVTNQATTAVTVDLGTRGLAMLAGGVIDAGVGTAIRGGSFLDALKGSLVSEVSAAGANAIGDASVSGSLVEAGTPGYWLAHAALGCASSAAMGTGCAGGAIGGAVSAGLNPIIDANGNIPPAVLTAIETLVSGSVAGSLGFNVQGAVTAAQNETLNNWLNHVTVLPGQQSQAQQLLSAMAACDSGNSSACTTVATLMQTSSANDQTLATACKSPGSLACAYQESRAYLAGNNISVANGVTVATDAQQPAYTAPSQAAATLDNMLGSPLAGIFGGLMYAAGASPTDAYYASVIGQATEGIAAGAAGFTMPSAPTNGSSASTSRATNNAPLGLGSTGRAVPNNLQEQLALQQAMSNPAAGVQLPIPLGDSRWPAADGWVKMSQNVNGVEIHYVRNVNSGAVDDFKFK
ncbi:filamentous hemagglutinin N-terminal domain-containing protein [Burkholderia gladioli]|uniref:two-partner secretion domain-containing protein n=1 Tax=Burkholderia gladioli TaxID=28095 RepID=UPI001640E719|nr:filamentous hemagglutinin N-terminal domain-containing protein [Burkholderia gladioli]MBU9319373.1 filamentous hemagglutinin N-terminal domain-containing protein [Burkholderia gladioli]